MLTRNFNLKSIGYYVQDRPKGATVVNTYPTKWVEKCSFVFEAIAKMYTLGDNEKKNSVGWVLKVHSFHFRTKNIIIDCNDACGTARLRKTLMNMLDGTVARIDLESFLEFISDDMRNNSKVIYSTTSSGRVCINGLVYWVFRNCICNANGRVIDDAPVIFRSEHSSVIPYMLPFDGSKTKSSKLLTTFMNLVFNYYGPRACHAVHILTSIAKALNREEIIEQEGGVSITNISGPPNIGKTFICVIAQCMIGCKDIILSQCSASAMLDVANSLHSLMVVWDDPRDVSSSQMCTIVHEAFHNHISTTLSKGVRKYNSSLIIGTQTPLLGLPHSDVNLATFTRLSHVAMTNDNTSYSPSRHDEDRLKNIMPELHNMLPDLLRMKYDKKEVDMYHNKLKKIAPDVVDRVLRALAVDWYFSTFFDSSTEMTSYFTKTSVAFLQKYCSRITPFCRFCFDMQTQIDNIPLNILKQKAKIMLKDKSIHECIAVYPKAYFEWLAKQMKNITYTQDMIHSAIRMSKGELGEVSRNVLFSSKSGNMVQRCYAIRKDAFQNAFQNVFS